jgi:hypothetical protein
VRTALFCCLPLGWEVVQLAVHQILDLIILVRVQASQPTFARAKTPDNAVEWLGNWRPGFFGC